MSTGSRAFAYRVTVTVGPAPTVVGFGLRVAQLIALLKRAGYEVKVHIVEETP